MAENAKISDDKRIPIGSESVSDGRKSSRSDETSRNSSSGSPESDPHLKSEWFVDLSELALKTLFVSYELIPTAGSTRAAGRDRLIRRVRLAKRLITAWTFLYSFKTLITILQSARLKTSDDDDPHPIEFYLGSFYLAFDRLSHWVVGFPIGSLFFLNAWSAYKLETVKDYYDWRIPFYYLSRHFSADKVWLKMKNSRSVAKFRKWSFLLLRFSSISRWLYFGIFTASFGFMLIVRWPAEYRIAGLIWWLLSLPIFLLMTSVSVLGLNLYLIICLFLHLKIKEMTAQLSKLLDQMSDRDRDRGLNDLLRQTLAEHDDLCGFVDGVNHVVRLFNFVIWTFVTGITSQLAMSLVSFYEDLSASMIIMFGGIIALGMSLLNAFFLLSAFLHSAIMDHFKLLNRLNVRIMSMDLEERNKTIDIRTRLDLLNAIERLGSSFIGFTCERLFVINFETYLRIVLTSIENILLFNELFFLKADLYNF